MNSRKRINFLRFREVQVFWNLHIAKVHAKLVAPDRKPFDVAQRLTFGQRKGHVFVAIAPENAGAAAFVAQSGGALVGHAIAVAHVEISGYNASGSNYFVIVLCLNILIIVK